MYRVACIALIVTMISGCGPSYEAEYQAALKELKTTQKLLTKAQQKLESADNDTRRKIFSLARRANSVIREESFDSSIIDNIQQEMTLLSQSYAQLNSNQDLSALTAQFYSEKLAVLLELKHQSAAAYDHQYQVCLSDLEAQSKKNDLSTMLCQVQANAAGLKPRQRVTANRTALHQLSQQLKSTREFNTPPDPQQLEQQYQTLVDKQLQNLD